MKKALGGLFGILAVCLSFVLMGCRTPSSGSTYTVSYEGNGNTSGTPPVDANQYSEGATVTLLGPGTLLRTGYAFSGWNTKADGTGTSYSQGKTFSMGNTDIKLYAKWSGNTYTVTFDSQSATTAANPASEMVTVPATMITALPTPPTKTGYTFGGWWTQTNGGGTQFTTSTTINADVTIYAKWILTPPSNVYLSYFPDAFGHGVYVDVHWTGSDIDKSYNVYSSYTYSGGYSSSYSLMGTTANTDYSDTYVNCLGVKSWQCYVTAVDSGNNESSPSSIATLIVN